MRSSRFRLWRWVLPLAALALGFLLLCPCDAEAGGLRAGFSGSRFACDRYESTIFCVSQGVIDGSNNLIDLSGANLLTYTESFDDASWTKVNVTATADQVRGPKSWTLNADLLAPTGADSYVYQDVTTAAGEYTCAFELRTATGTVDLSVHVYNQAHGAIRTTEAVTVTSVWQRFDVNGSTVAGDTEVGCTIGGNNTWSTGEDVYAVRAQLQANDSWRRGPGVYHPVLAAVTKPALDLAPTNAPSSANAGSDFQCPSGNRCDTRGYNGTNQLDSVAHHASMNMFDSNFTLTMVLMRDSGDAGNAVAFSHGSTDSDGFYLQASVASGQWIAQFSKAAAHAGPVVTANTIDGAYHVVQVVREDDVATLIVDGTTSTPVDVSTYGIDANRTLYVGAYDGGSLHWDGEIAYVRLDNEALSPDELARDREYLWGIVSSLMEVARCDEIEDGDMEDAGTTEWTGFNDAALSKETGDPHSGTQVLRIAHAGTNFPGALQVILDSGTLYRAFGWARGDGTWGPGVGYDSTLAWSGTTSTEWQFFDVEFRAIAPLGSFFLGSNATGAGYVEYDDVSVILFENYIMDFSRYSVAYTTFADGTMAEVAQNVPRIGGDGGGVLVEGQSQNLCLQSKTFNVTWGWVELTGGDADGMMAPDGTVTMDGTIADADNESHGLSQSLALSLGETHTASVYATPGDQDWLYLEAAPVGNATAYFDLADGVIGTVGAGATAGMESLAYGVRRCWITFAGAAATDFLIYTAEADGDNTFAGDTVTVNTWLWEAQVELGAFPTSPITTTNVPVTKLADDITFDPHPDNGTEWILPMEYGPTANATGLTVYLEAKCQFADNTELDVNRMFISISGNTGTAPREANHNHNRMSILTQNTGAIQAFVITSDTVGHIATTAANPVDYSEWFSMRVFFDFSDFSRMAFWMQQCDGECSASDEVETVAFYTNNTGTGTFYTDDVEPRLGQWYYDVVNAHCHIRNPRIWNEEIAP